MRARVFAQAAPHIVPRRHLKQTDRSGSLIRADARYCRAFKDRAADDLGFRFELRFQAFLLCKTFFSRRGPAPETFSLPGFHVNKTGYNTRKPARLRRIRTPISLQLGPRAQPALRGRRQSQVHGLAGVDPPDAASAFGAASEPRPVEF